MAQPDLYKVLGRRQEGVARRDQEGLPQARAPVPPGPQPGRREGRGALQGDPGRLRRPRRPREAQAVRPRRPVRLGGAGGRRRAGGGGGGFDAGGFGDILSNLFGGGGGGAGGAARGRPARRARPRPRGRGRDLASTRRSRARRSRSASPTARRARPATAPAPSPGTAPKVCPRCQGRGIESAGPGPVLDLPAVLALRRLRHGHRGPVPDLPRRRRRPHGQAATASTSPPACSEGTRVRLAGKGEPGRNGGPPGDLYVITHVQPVAGLQAQGRQPRGRGPAHDPRGDPRRRGRGADAQRPQDAARPAPARSTARVQRLRGEGPPKLGGKGARRHPLPLRHRRPARRSSAEQSEAVDKLRR